MKRFHKKLLKTTVSALILSALASPAFAADLRENLVVTDPVIRLSDLFTDTGAEGETVVMEAPAPGKRAPISSYELTRLAEEHNLEWDRPSYLKRVYVHREGESFNLNDLKPMILELAREEGLDDDVKIRIYGRKTGLYLPVGFGAEDLELEDFALNNQKTRFSAKLKLPTGTQEEEEVRISGTLDAVRLIPVFNRLIAPGDVVSEKDVEWIKISARRINRSTILSSASLIGQTVKRALPANKIIRESDIAAPVAVEKGSIVQMTYQSGLLTLSMQGRALEEGGIGDTIRIMNPKSKKTVFARIQNAGTVTVESSNHTRLAAN